MKLHELISGGLGKCLLVASLLLAGCGDDDEPPVASDTTGAEADVAEPDGSDTGDTGDTGGLPGVMPMIDLDGAGLFDAPYPSDLRMKDGKLDLTGFPNPNDVELVVKYVAAAEELVKGFSLTPSVVFRFEDAIEPKSISTVAESWQPGSNVILVDVDKDSTFFSTRYPVQTSWWGTAQAEFIAHQSLTVQPLFGTPLRESTTYACIVTRGVKGGDGEPIGQPAIVAEGLKGEGPLGDAYEPLRFWLEKKAFSQLEAEEIAVATVFTTDAPTAGLSSLADFVQNESTPPALESLVLSELEYNVDGGHTKDYDMYEGVYGSPNFQSGEKPYVAEGGDIKYDGDGKPIVQEVEQLRFALAVPTGGEMPEKGWPIVMYGHGTGGDWKSFAGGSTYSPASQLTQLGIAVMGIDQPLHGTRYEGDEGGEIINSFNFFNVAAARTNFRQSAIDVMVQGQFVRNSLIISSDVARSGDEIRFDPDNVYFFGHSHGGLSGGLFAPFIKGVKAIVLSGAGGGLSETTIRRKDILNIKAVLEAALFVSNPDEMTTFHPAVALMQNLVDVTDPLTYAPLYNHPAEGVPPINILLTEGTNDKQTPGISTDNLAAAAKIPILKPAAQPSQAHGILGIPTVERPVSGNYVYGQDKRTAALAQFEDADHFAVFTTLEAVKIYTSFISSTIQDGLPTID